MDADQAQEAPPSPVGFEAHVRPLFRERDRRSMLHWFDLWSYEDVVAHADDVLERLDEGQMPCDAAWPDDQVDVVRRWLADGLQP